MMMTSSTFHVGAFPVSGSTLRGSQGSRQVLHRARYIPVRRFDTQIGIVMPPRHIIISKVVMHFVGAGDCAKGRYGAVLGCSFRYVLIIFSSLNLTQFLFNLYSKRKPKCFKLRTETSSSAPTPQTSTLSQSLLVSHETIRSLEAELDHGASIAALRRFNDNLAKLDASSWEAKLRPVMNELAFNLESFNPAFTAVLLRIQSTIGCSDYVRRDMALKKLIQPLAGEYGMHNGELQAKTHRELFSDFYADLMREPLQMAVNQHPHPPAASLLFQQMMRDLCITIPQRRQDGGVEMSSMEAASYAMGYNLAIEYLADYEKTWMLDSFRTLNNQVLAPTGRPLTEWLFLEVHAEGEAEHAAIGHDAVATLVPAEHEHLLRRAMLDHDRDFSAFYNTLADMLE